MLYFKNSQFWFVNISQKLRPSEEINVNPHMGLPEGELGQLKEHEVSRQNYAYDFLAEECIREIKYLTAYAKPIQQCAIRGQPTNKHYCVQIWVWKQMIEVWRAGTRCMKELQSEEHDNFLSFQFWLQQW